MNTNSAICVRCRASLISNNPRIPDDYPSAADPALTSRLRDALAPHLPDL